jgi:ABC-2 type transport system permease protein
MIKLSAQYLIRIFRVSLISELKSVIRYVSLWGLLAFNFSVPFFYILTSWIIAVLMGGQLGFFMQTTGVKDYVSYVIVGFAFTTFIFSTTFGGSRALRGEQEEGTLELVFVTPANKLAWLLGKTVGNLLFSIITFSIVLTSGIFLFGFKPNTNTLPNVPLAALGIGLTMLALTAFGYIFAGICFLAKREEEIGQVLWTLFTFFCGLAFPVAVLPAWAQTVALAIPITHGLNITRNALLLGMGFTDSGILLGLGILLLQTAIMLPIGIALFARLEKTARKTGALATY